MSRQSTYRRLVATGWLTNQHGAWAMMLVPITVGSLMAGLTWLQLLLLVAWLTAFFFYSALTLWMRVYASDRKRRARVGSAAGEGESQSHARLRRRLARYRPALTAYGVVAGVATVALVLLRPTLLWWGVPIGALFAVAAVEGMSGRERSVASRVSAILAAQLLTPISYSLGATPDNWTDVWIATAALTVYFVGTVPYVKTLLRERGKRSWLLVSVGYHALVLVVAAALAATGHLSWWVVGLAGLWLVRAVALPLLSNRGQRPLRPAVVGLTEVAVSILVVLGLVLPSTLT